MHFKNEKEAGDAIELWREFSSASQLVNLRQAIGSAELDQMHYEQRGNSIAVERCERCLVMLRERLGELDNS